jgi:tetratricopeptide (TPR) repeat protein
MIPALLLLAVPLLTGCQKIQARSELKQGNALYQSESYRAALRQYQRGLELDPEATFAWRSVGLTALALYQPGTDTPENRQYATTATEAFEKYLLDYPEDQKVREYLMSMYVNAEMYDKALAYIDNEMQAKPEMTAQLQNTKLQVLVKANRFEEVWTFIQQHKGGNRADVLYTYAVSAWDKSYRDPTIDFDTRTQFVDRGLQAASEAVKLKPDFADAMIYNGLLLREKAKLETDALRRTELITEAVDWAKKATELKKKQQKPAAPAGEQAQAQGK